jgi:hypothetical protein
MAQRERHVLLSPEGATAINGMAMWPFIDGRMVEEW